MKTVKTHFRTGGIKGKGLSTQYKSQKVKQKVNSFEEFIELNAPVESSEKLLSAIKKAYNENGSVIFNCGKGNQTFYFYEN